MRTSAVGPCTVCNPAIGCAIVVTSFPRTMMGTYILGRAGIIISLAALLAHWSGYVHDEISRVSHVSTLGRCHFSSCWMLRQGSHDTRRSEVPIHVRTACPRCIVGLEVDACHDLMGHSELAVTRTRPKIRDIRAWFACPKIHNKLKRRLARAAFWSNA